MTPLVIAGLIAGIPALLAILLRVNSLYMFVSIVSGYLLIQFTGDTAGLTARSFVRGSQTEVVAKLVLFGLPLLITFLFLRKTTPKKQVFFQVVPWLSNGLLILVLSLPLLSDGVRGAITSTTIGNSLNQNNDLIIAGVAVLQLLIMWAFGKAKKPEHKKHKS